MKLDLFLQKTSNLTAENGLLKFVVLIIGVVVVFNTFMLKRALNTRRTILVPSVINSRMEILGDSASEKYIKGVTRDIMNLAMNYSPATARTQFDELLMMYAPGAYPEASRLFYDLADSIETAKISNVFYIQKITLDGSNTRIDVTGRKRQFMQDVKVEDASETFSIYYKIRSGKFMIVKISEKESEER